MGVRSPDEQIKIINNRQTMSRRDSVEKLLVSCHPKQRFTNKENSHNSALFVGNSIGNILKQNITFQSLTRLRNSFQEYGLMSMEAALSFSSLVNEVKETITATNHKQTQ